MFRWLSCSLLALCVGAAYPAFAYLELPAAGGVNVSTVVILKQPLSGQGNLSVSAATSTAINAGLTQPSNSTTFPTGTLPGLLTIKNTGNSTLAVCWQGGLCSSSVGEPLAAGESVSESLPRQNMTAQPPTVYSGSASSATIKW